jgi:NitT/TauT family transport system ATP-binding protein
MSTEEVTIALDGVGKTFGGEEGVRALQNISCQIFDREFVAVLGPSGCGKSTMLRIIGGLIPHEEGTATVLGKPVRGPSDDIGIVFQRANLLPWRTVEGNLRLGVEESNVPTEELREQVQTMVEMLGLTDFEKSHPHELSGGMRRRVAIGQALMRNPRVMLMDEPFGALDALTRDRLNVELLRIWQAERKTVVLVTHSISEAVFLSDRVLVMSERPGRIIEEVRIDLPRPRDPKTLPEVPEFGQYRVQLGELMGVV